MTRAGTINLMFFKGPTGCDPTKFSHLQSSHSFSFNWWLHLLFRPPPSTLLGFSALNTNLIFGITDIGANLSSFSKSSVFCWGALKQEIAFLTFFNNIMLSVPDKSH